MKIKKVLCLAMSLMFTTSLFSACGGGKDSSDFEVDNTKTQFLIGNYNGGYGTKWIREAAKKFEEKFAGTSFEEGKMGVQVQVQDGKDEISGSNYTFAVDMNNRPHDLYISHVPREEATSQGRVVDLSDILDDPLTEFGESKSILDKMTDWYKTNFYIEECLEEKEPIYTIPYSMAFFGTFSYDIDLFENADYQFYIKDGATNLNDNNSWTGAENKSVGCDGVKGTYDDGLPTNETEFFALLNRMYIRGITPTTFTGTYEAYHQAWAQNLFLNSDDAKGWAIEQNGVGSYTWTNGTDTTSDDWTIERDGTGYDWYKMAEHPGRLEALKVMEQFVKNENYYSSNAFKTSQTQVGAQTEFLLSVLTNTRIGMLLEGTWWENEAQETFDKMASSNSSLSRMNRRMGIMPPIAVSNGTAEKTSFLTTSQGAFINANTKNIEVAKLFIKYLATDEVANIFVTNTGTPYPYQAEYKQETIDSLSTFGKQLLEISQNKNGKYIFASERSSKKIKGRTSPADIAATVGGFQTLVGDSQQAMTATTNYPLTWFKFSAGAYTAQDYFNGIKQLAYNVYDNRFAGKVMKDADGDYTIPNRK